MTSVISFWVLFLTIVAVIGGLFCVAYRLQENNTDLRQKLSEKDRMIAHHASRHQVVIRLFAMNHILELDDGYLLVKLTKTNHKSSSAKVYRVFDQEDAIRSVLNHYNVPYVEPAT